MLKITLFFMFTVLAVAGPQDKANDDQQRRAEFTKTMAALRKQPKDYAEFIELIQRALGMLGYGTTFTGRMDGRTIEALREYQRHNNMTVGGSITYDVVRKLLVDGKAAKTEPIPLPPSHTELDQWEKGFVSVSGTWVNDGDSEPAMPRVSQITCYKDGGFCIEAIAMMFMGTLKADSDLLEIERWDDVEIVTKPLQANCTRTITRINLAQALVTSLRSTISTDPSCAAVDKNELHSVLKSGADIYATQLLINNAIREKAIRTGATAVPTER
jgi:hypothetical protein